MNLIHDHQNSQPGGQVVPVPEAITRLIFSWATATYRRYDFGQTLVQELIGRKLSIYHWLIHVDAESALYVGGAHPILTLWILVSGGFTITADEGMTRSFDLPSFDLIYLPAGLHPIKFETGRNECFHVELSRTFLEDTGDDHPVIAELIAMLDSESKSIVGAGRIPLNYISKNILHNMRHCSEKGATLSMEMQKYIIELLSEYFRGIAEVQKEEGTRYVGHKETLVRIKNAIMEAPDIHEQTQEKISVRFGISMTMLKMNFSALFGFPLATFVRFHALMKAHYLIATTRRSIDDISVDIGYSNRTAFNQAFKKQFGYLPSGVRANIERRDQTQQD